MAFAIPTPKKSASFQRLERWLDVLTGPLGALSTALALALLCGLFVESRSLALAAAFAAILVLGICYPWLAVRAVSGQVSFATLRLREGESLAFSVELRNRAWLPLLGLQVRGIAAGSEEKRALHALRGRESRTFLETQEGLARGGYPQQQTEITCSFPFGLITARRPLECHQEVLVWPLFFPAPGFPLGSSEEVQEGSVASRRAGTAGDLLGVRDFRRGDSLRRIHWAQTARHERLIVTERQAVCLPRVQVILELSGAQGGPESEREWAIRGAMSLLESWARLGVQLELVILDEEPRQLTCGISGFRDSLARLPGRSGADQVAAVKPLPSGAGVRALVTTANRLSLGSAELVLVAEAGGVRCHEGH